jgi:hypothetical protein
MFLKTNHAVAVVVQVGLYVMLILVLTESVGAVMELEYNQMTEPQVKLRWLIKERTEMFNTSWCSGSTPQKTKVQSKPILQYSLDGCTWVDVPLVVLTETN